MRFPEFTDEWTTINLGDIGYFKNGVNKSKNDFGSGYPFINLEDIFDKNAIYNNKYNLVKVSDKELQEYDLKKGDVLFVRSSVKLEGIGLTSVVMEDLKDTVYSGFIIRFREYNKTLDDNYKKYCFYVTSFRNNIISKSTTSANTNINQPSLKKMTLSIPSLKEQEKIANFLSKIDRKIKLLKNKKEEFIEFKHYLLQNLFPQNGGTAPKLRFNQFTTNNWKTVTLVECVTCLDSERKPLNEEKRRKNRGVFPYYGANGLVDHINQYIFNDTLVLLAEDGGFFNEYTEKPIAQLVNGKIWVNNHAHVLKNKNNLNITFLYYSLVHKDIRKYINGTSRSKLNQKDMFSIVINITSIEEQKKIASFLSFVDKKIDLLDQEIEQVEEYKKGLLQKMFIWRVYLFYCCILSSEYLEIMFYIMIFFLRYVLLTLVSDLMSHIF